ncbi:MAG: PepSY domain-containing protein [Sphingomonas sp.]|nr:PepSY domain-containing protein [Sphingomonas sp.]
MRRSKRVAVQVHLWLGLVVGLLWSLQGLTGATLVFHRELDRWVHSEWRGGPGLPLPADQLIAIAEKSSGRPVTALGILDAGRDLRTATYTDASGMQNMLLLDASSGVIVGQRQPQPVRPSDGSTSRFVYMIHQKLVSGHSGEVVIGLSGCLLLLTAILGLWIAWPRRGNWRSLIIPRGWRTLSQKLYSWHRLAGLAFGIVFVFVAIGGIYMTFADPIRKGLGEVIDLQSPYEPAPSTASSQWLAAQTAVNVAARLFPDAQFVRLAMPTKDKPVYIVRLRQPGEVRAWSGATAVTLDAVKGDVLQIQDGLRGPLADRILDAQFSIHNGEAAGLLGRLLIMLAGLSLPTFYLTGLWLWFRKRWLRAVKRAQSGQSPRGALMSAMGRKQT